MTESLLQLVVIPPGGAGIELGLHQCLMDGSIVTSYDDSRLRLMSDLVGGSFDCEFVPFGDLVGRVMRMGGLESQQLVTRGQLNAMTQLAGQFLETHTPLERAARLPGLPKLILETMEELRDSGLRIDDLAHVAQNSEGNLGSKLGTLVEIHDLVKDSMDVSRRQTVGDRIDACLQIESFEPGPMTHIVVLGGPEIRVPYDQFLNWLSRQGVRIHLLLEAIPDRTDLFQESLLTMTFHKGKRPLVVEHKGWYESLFSDSVGAHSPELSLTSAFDDLAEAEWVFRTCSSLLSNGVSSSQIGVFARDLASCGPRIQYAADRYGVQLSSTRTSPLLSSGFARTTLNLLRACIHPDVRQLALLGKNSYCAISDIEFEQVWPVACECSKGGQDGWQEFTNWLESQCESYSWFQAIVTWRKESHGTSCKLSKWLEKLRQLVGMTALSQDSLDSDHTLDHRDARAQTVLQRAIADLAFVYDQSGQKELNLSEFTELATALWEESTLTVTRSGLGIQLLSDVHALPSFDYLFVMGMSEGSLPRRRTEDPLLFDQDRLAISEATSLRIPNSRDKARKEREFLLKLCASAQKHLYMSYPMTSSGQINTRTFYIEEVVRASGKPLAEIIIEPESMIPRVSESHHMVDQKLRAALDAEPELLSHKVSDPLALKTLEFDWHQAVSLSHIAVASVCPFESVFRHKFHVYPTHRSGGNSLIKGVPARASIATALNEEDATKRLESALENRIDSVAPSLEPWDVAMLYASGKKLIKPWVVNEFHSREFWKRDETRVNCSLIDAGFRSEVKRRGLTIILEHTFESISWVNGYRIVQMYENSNVDVTWFKSSGSDRWGSSEFDPRKRALARSVLLYGFSTKIPGIGIEYDCGEYGRKLIYVDRMRLGEIYTFRSKSDIKLSVSRLANGENLNVIEDFSNESKQIFDRGLNAILDAKVSALPGAHCHTCNFGEICRASEVMRPGRLKPQEAEEDDE